MMKALKSVLRCQTRFSGKAETSSGEPDVEIETVILTCQNIPSLGFLTPYAIDTENSQQWTRIFLESILSHFCSILPKVIYAVDGVLRDMKR